MILRLTEDFFDFSGWSPMADTGPLGGVKVLELEGLGPGPHGAMLLADLGADVLTVLRTAPIALTVPRPDRLAPSTRGKRAVMLDLKSAAGTATFLRLAAQADVLIDPLRPGVTERLGVGPVPCLERNPKLVYARVTGWGQQGPLAAEAGHDLNYLAVSGVLNALGRAGQPPTTPPGLIADFGGGSMLLAVGVLAALTEASRSGRGQVVDVAMIDGVATLAAQYYALSGAGLWREERGSNYLDSGAPYYDVYRCADGRFVAVAALEDRFYANLVAGLGLDPDSLPDRSDHACWPELRQILGAQIAMRTRDEWAEHFYGRDACVSPVLSFSEAQQHPHAIARRAFVEVDGVRQPAPAPRFAQTAAPDPEPRRHYEGDEADQIIADWGNRSG
jgi:alpha-methylacyl-CoA racemase